MFREPPYFDFFPQGRATAPPLTFPKISNLLSNVNDHFMDHPGVIFIFIRGGRLGGKTKFAPQYIFCNNVHYGQIVLVYIWCPQTLFSSPKLGVIPTRNSPSVYMFSGLIFNLGLHTKSAKNRIWIRTSRINRIRISPKKIDL